MADIFASSSTLKVIAFLSEHPHTEFVGSEVEKATGISRAGVYLSLQALTHEDLVVRQRKGRLFIYRLNAMHPVVKQYKTLRAVHALRGFVDTVKKYSRKIVLFGSASRGEDAEESDRDIFIIAKDVDAIRVRLQKMRNARIQAVIKTQTEVSEMHERDAVFMNEVAEGIVLWKETGNDHDRI